MWVTPWEPKGQVWSGGVAVVSSGGKNKTKTLILNASPNKRFIDPTGAPNTDAERKGRVREREREKKSSNLGTLRVLVRKCIGKIILVLKHPAGDAYVFECLTVLFPTPHG